MGGIELLEARTLLTAVNLTSVSDLTAAEGELRFWGQVGSDPGRYWKTNGSREGTTPLTEVEFLEVRAETFEVGSSLFRLRFGQIDVWLDGDITQAPVRLEGISQIDGGEFEHVKVIAGFQDSLFFAADDGVHGVELWKSDGTPDGTALVRDVVPGELGSSIENFVVFNDELYFLVEGDGLDGLWKTDGTDDGTIRVVEGNPFAIVPIGEHLYQWSRSDGLTRVDDAPIEVILRPSFLAHDQTQMIEADGMVYFAALSEENSDGPTILWKTDGTADGTAMVQNPDGAEELATDPSHFVYYNGALLFFAGPPNQRAIWTSDGTSAGTIRLDTPLTGLQHTQVSMGWGELNGVLYFAAMHPDVGRELARTDGTEEGTYLVKDLSVGPTGSSPREFTVVGDRIYFVARQHDNDTTLFVSDGTPEGTRRVFDPKGSDTPALFVPETSQILITPYLRKGAAEETRSYDGEFEGLVSLVGDFVGDFKDRMAFFDGVTSTFYLTNDDGLAVDFIQYGPRGADWVPLLGDWDGDGLATFSLFDPVHSVFYVKNSLGPGEADLVVSYGPAGHGWLPLAGDWDASGQDSFAVYDPATSSFFFKNELAAGAADAIVQFGQAGINWVPLAGDWNATGHDTPGLFDPVSSRFYLRNRLEPGAAETSAQYGTPAAGWLPIVGDWDGRTVKPPAQTGGVTFYNHDPNETTMFATFFGTTLGADTYHVSKRDGVVDLTPSELVEIVDAAILRWVAAGVDEAFLEPLRNYSFSIVDLQRSHLRIHGEIDRDAAGWGWYVDPTPLVDEEFEFEERHLYGATVELVAKRYDLLSAVIQYLGRELGIVAELDNSDVMGTVLPKGVRRLPDAAVVDRLLGESG